MELVDDTERPLGIGQAYFTAGRDDKDRPVSKYQGMVIGHIIRRDDGSEFEVRSGVGTLPFAKRALSKDELDKLKTSMQVQGLHSDKLYTVLRVLPVYGDVWVRDEETGDTKVMKAKELRMSDVQR